MNVGIYFYDDAEVLDFSGPFEVFSTASRVSDKTGLFNVCLIAEHKQLVRARAGFQVQPDYSIDDHPPLDILIVVGGVHYGEMEKPAVLEWIKNQSTQVKITASVCTGAFLLAKAQVLTDETVTTHWEDIGELRTLFPMLNVVENTRWVDEGRFVTSGGISAGIDMSLHLVARLTNKELAVNTAKQMEFDWTQN